MTATQHTETLSTVNGNTGAQMATRIAFLVAGLGMAAWAPLVPFAKIRIALSDGTLGLLLLCLGGGSLLAMPITGFLTSRFGCRKVILAAGVMICLALPLLATASSVPTMALSLLLFGAAMGIIDVGMNVQAVIVERESGKAMMSGFHGFFSIGGIAGAGSVTGLLWLGLSPLEAMLLLVVLLVLLLLAAQKNLVPGSENNGDDVPLFVVPRGKVIFLGILCFIMFLAEGAMLDWSALFLSSQRGVSATQAGLGFAIFSVAMAIGRLTGDKIVAALGRLPVMTGGSLCAACGLLLAISLDNAYLSMLGFMLVGLGASNVVPLLFSAAGSQKSMSASMAIAAMTTIGYAGILAGPALIGFVAQWTSLSIALGCIAALLLLVSVSARAAIR